MTNRRLDQMLVERGLCSSREQARRAILAGQVTVNQQRAAKPGSQVRPIDQLQLAAPEIYVSRGGYKLEHALRAFALDVAGWVAADLGASTGGFTDCLLQHGAARVYAVDVGRAQLAWRLRQDPRVVVMERTNARYLDADSFPGRTGLLDLVVIDCSFISIKHLLPSVIEFLMVSGKVVALIKPQFEAGKPEADRGAGVIRDPAIHERVLASMKAFVQETGRLRWCGTTASPLLGPAGNREFFALLEKIG